MSSNTLRGIGQEGDDGGEGKGKSPKQGDSASASASASARKVRPEQDDEGGRLLDKLQQLRGVRSLDSTIPGTRSLDSSVPGGQPSLDAKVPTLAATLMGLAVPLINSREQGTVQGRDVHLPVETQRVAGMLGIVGSRDAIPDPVEHSERTVADPVRTAVLAHSEAESIHGNARGQPDLSSHAPWYDQEPVGGDVYDDPRPNFMGRVAIGVAAAAGISVVLFASARLRNLDNAAEQAEQAAEVQERPAVSAPNRVPTPTALPMPPPLTGTPGNPLPEPTPGTDVRSVEPVPGFENRPAVSRFAGMRAGRPAAGAAGVTGPMSPMAAAGQGATPPKGARVQSGSGTPATSQMAAPASSAPNTTVSAAPPVVTATPSTSPTAPAHPLAQAAAEAEPPPPSPAPAAPTPAAPKHPASRGKPTYDPDSTLPLNLD